MAICMIKTPEQRKIKLNNRDAEKFCPETYKAERVDKKSFAEFLRDVETYLSVLAYWRDRCWNGLPFRDQAIVMSDVEAYEVAHGNPFDWNLKEVSAALGPLLHKVCRSSARVKLKALLKTTPSISSWDTPLPRQPASNWPQNFAWCLDRLTSTSNEKTNLMIRPSRRWRPALHVGKLTSIALYITLADS